MTPSLYALITLATAGLVVPQYFLLGFTHILPGGPDHVLFVLGLFFLVRNFSVLLFYVKTIARPASALIALTGLYWAVDRACF